MLNIFFNKGVIVHPQWSSWLIAANYIFFAQTVAFSFYRKIFFKKLIFHFPAFYGVFTETHFAFPMGLQGSPRGLRCHHSALQGSPCKLE